MQIDRDSLYQVLLNLPPETIGQYCQTNREARQICSNDQFWQEKLKHDFPPINFSSRYVYNLMYTTVQDIINQLFTKLPRDDTNEFYRIPIFPLELEYINVGRTSSKFVPNIYIGPVPSLTYPGPKPNIYNMSQIYKTYYILVERDRGDPTIDDLIRSEQGKEISKDEYYNIRNKIINSGNYVAKIPTPGINQTLISKLEKLGLTTRID